MALDDAGEFAHASELGFLAALGGDFDFGSVGGGETVEVFGNLFWRKCQVGEGGEEVACRGGL